MFHHDTMGRAERGFRPEKIGGFVEAAYRFDEDDQSWLKSVMEAARAVWGRGGPAHGGIYDASDPAAFRVGVVNFIDCSERSVQILTSALSLITAGLVRRTFHRIAANCLGALRVPELGPMVDGMSALGCPDALNINGLDPSGLGVYFALWGRDLAAMPRAELTIYRRMAHHLGAAYRCRRRLREREEGPVDATVDAEAILDARHRVVHAVGPAREAKALAQLRDTARARGQTRRAGADNPGGLERWSPLTGLRWTLVDTFDCHGARYVVARENRAEVRGLATLSDRERQVVAYLVMGQSTKETAYALGISDVTVRVLIRRAATKLGVGSRESLLAHDEVRRLQATGEARRPRRSPARRGSPT